MSQLTKRTIVDTTVRLAEKKPISKITVRDIVEECGITRNTFYYHFHDIFEVLEEAVDVGFEQMKSSWNGNTEEELLSLVDFCFTYKKVLFNLYKTLGHEQLSKYAVKKLHSLLLEYIETLAADMQTNKADIEMVCIFYEEALIGTLFRWLREGREQDYEQTKMKLLRMKQLFEGQILLTLENFSKPQ